MKLTVLLFIAITFFLESCSQPLKNNTFEGTLTYKITFTPKSDNTNYNDYQKQKYGNEMKLYISKNGNFKREFTNNGEKGFEFFEYNVATNKSFVKWRNIDTVYSSSCATNSLQFVNENSLPAENVFGQLCESYYVSGIEPKSGQIVALTYLYPKSKEYINPNFYKAYNDFFYNKVMEKTKAPFYKLLMDMGKYSITFEVEKIESGKIDPGIFNLPTNIPVKES